MEQTENKAPIIAHVDDIEKGFAENAFRNTSFKPEERGESRRKTYADEVNGLYSELWPLAATEAQRELLAVEMERFREGYLTRMKAFLASHSNVASTMITGAANFPSSRNQKRGQWADNRLKDLYEWDEKARESIKRKLLDARPEEEKASEEWERVKREVISSITSGNSLIYSNLSGRLERMANKGEVELIKKSLEVIRQYNATAARPVFTARHKVWTFEGIAEKVAAKYVQTEPGGLAILMEGDGVRVVVNHSADRVQILFDGKPDEETIAKLRKAAWKWSPSNKAWQRMITDASKRSAKQLLGL